MKRSYRPKDNKRLYRVWIHMKERCCSPQDASYHNYGGRGIKICDEWKDDFHSFCKWALRNGYDASADRKQCTLDRIDNDGDYCPKNCRWTTMKEQSRNRRGNRIVDLGLEKYTSAELAEMIGLKPATLRKRLDSGWSVKDSVLTPLLVNKSSIYRNHKEKGDEMEKMLTPSEVAKILRCRKQTVYMLLESGLLCGFKIGNGWRIRPECLQAYMEGAEHG